MTGRASRARRCIGCCRAHRYEDRDEVRVPATAPERSRSRRGGVQEMCPLLRNDEALRQEQHEGGGRHGQRGRLLHDSPGADAVRRGGARRAIKKRLLIEFTGAARRMHHAGMRASLEQRNQSAP